MMATMQTKTLTNTSKIGVQRYLHSIIAGLIIVLMFAGFAQTYYLKFLFPGDPLSILLHFHGLVMTAWILLFALQVVLIASGKQSLHRRIGKWGMVLAAMALMIGMLTAIESARQVQNQTGGLGFLATSLGGILILPD